MCDFLKVLHVEGFGLLPFSFNCILSPQKKKYHVSVTAHSKEIHFTMFEQYGCWKIADAPKPPDWLMALEQKLALLIPEQEKIARHERGNQSAVRQIA